MWLLTVLIVLWATAVAALLAVGVVLCRTERQQGRTGHHPARRPVPDPRLRWAVSVAEIQRRLAAEAAQPPPPTRNITIIRRATRPTRLSPARPAETGPDTEPVPPLEASDDDNDGGGGGAGNGR